MEQFLVGKVLPTQSGVFQSMSHVVLHLRLSEAQGV